MIFTDLAAGDAVFVDANTCVYHFSPDLQEIPLFGIRVLTIPLDLLDAAAAVSQSTGLLTNDALIVAVMQAHGLTKIASNDSDFDRVPGIIRYGPA